MYLEKSNKTIDMIWSAVPACMKTGVTLMHYIWYPDFGELINK